MVGEDLVAEVEEGVGMIRRHRILDLDMATSRVEVSSNRDSNSSSSKDGDRGSGRD